MIPTLLGQIVIGWLIADFLGGLFHWWEDRVARLDMPLIGAWIVAPNRLHHVEPLAFLRGTFWDRNLALIVTAAIICATWSALFGPSVTLAVTMIGGAITNEVHAWAHQPSTAPRLVRLGQEIGILQSPKHHAAHHRPPQDRNYCILTDWVNPLLESVRFWARLEATLTRIGLEPNRGAR